MMKCICAAFSLFFLCANSAHAQEVVVGAHYFEQTVPIGTTVMISPSSNVNGLSLKTANISTSQNQLAYIQADFPDGTHRAILFANSNTGGSNFANLPYALYLPTGIGLSAVYGPSSAGTVAITYDLH